jgi:hypothetical protein
MSDYDTPEKVATRDAEQAARPTVGGDYGSARKQLGDLIASAAGLGTEAACICDPHSPLIAAGCSALTHRYEPEHDNRVSTEGIADSAVTQTFKHGEIASVERDRDRILRTARELISGDRERDYGSAAVGFERTGKMWAAILGLDEVTAEQVAMCMAALKISRLCATPNHDESWVDGVGYLALGGDIAATPGRYL